MTHLLLRPVDRVALLPDRTHVRAARLPHHRHRRHRAPLHPMVQSPPLTRGPTFFTCCALSDSSVRCPCGRYPVVSLLARRLGKKRLILFALSVQARAPSRLLLATRHTYSYYSYPSCWECRPACLCSSSSSAHRCCLCRPACRYGKGVPSTSHLRFAVPFPSSSRQCPPPDNARRRCRHPPVAIPIRGDRLARTAFRAAVAARAPHLDHGHATQRRAR